MIGLTQGSLIYADYTSNSTIFLGGLDNLLRLSSNAFASSMDWRIFSFRLMLSLFPPQEKGYNMPLVKLQKFINDVVIDSPHIMGRARNAPPQANNQGCN
jgi:hypothetical protein